MRLLGGLLLTVLVLAALRAAVTILILVALLTVLIALTTAPIRTLSTMLLIVLMQAFAAHPGLGLCLLIAVLLFVARSCH